MHNKILNVLGEIIGIADVVGADVPGADPIPLIVPLISGIGSTLTLPTQTPSGQTGQSVLQIGNVATNEIYSKNTEFWSGCPGIISLPALPSGTNATDACQVMYMNRNGQNIGYAYRDTRYYPQGMKAGETIIHCPNSKAKFKVDNDGGVTMGTQTSSGQNTYFQINPNGLYYVAPWGSFSIDVNGMTFTHASGASITLGGFASGVLPGPLAGLTSFVNINAGMFNAQATAVSLGAGPAYSPAIVSVSPVMAPYTPMPMFTTMPVAGVSISLT